MDRFQDQVRAYALQQEIVQLQRVQQKLDDRIRHAAALWLRLQHPQELPVSTGPAPVTPAAERWTAEYNNLLAAERWTAEYNNLLVAGLSQISSMPAGELIELTVRDGQVRARFPKIIEIWGRGGRTEVLVLKTQNEAGELLDYQTFVTSASVAAIKP